MPVLSKADRESGHYGLYAPKNLYDFELEKTPDMAVLLPAFEEGLSGLSGAKSPEELAAAGTFETSLQVSSTDRALGTIFGSEITKRFGNQLAEDQFVIHAKGGGGQSFGAFLPKGATIRRTGDANDGF